MSTYKSHTVFLQNQCVYVRNAPHSQALIQQLKQTCKLVICVYEKNKQKTITEECWREWVNEQTSAFYYVFPRYVLHTVHDLDHLMANWTPATQKIILDKHDSLDTVTKISHILATVALGSKLATHSDNADKVVDLFHFEGQLHNDHRKQVNASQAVVQALRQKGGAILSMPPGTGKTVTTCFVISTLRLPSVILTHTSELQSQWRDRLTQFLPFARVGVFTTQTPINSNDYDVILVMMQTCSLQTTQPFKNIGLVVVDEAHHICAVTLRLCFDKFNCPYTLGLTATPTRKDKRTPLLFWMIGPMAFLLQVPYEVPVHLLTVQYTDKRMTRCGSDNFQCHRMISLNINRTHNVLATAFRKLPDIGKRNILVLASRIDVVRQAYEYIKTVLSVKYDFLPECVQRLTSGAMVANAHAKNNARILVCTSALVSEGFDLPRLDTLIRLMPCGESIQTYGRVMRMCNEKNLPVCIVEVNDVSNEYLQALYAKRVSILKRGFTPDCPFTTKRVTSEIVCLSFDV